MTPVEVDCLVAEAKDCFVAEAKDCFVAEANWLELLGEDFPEPL
jgi:hypothetical protein